MLVGIMHSKLDLKIQYFGISFGIKFAPAQNITVTSVCHFPLSLHYPKIIFRLLCVKIIFSFFPF